MKDSGVTRNYLFIYDLIVQSGLSFDEIFNALEKLIIIDLRLELSDNPQLIFESLNSTGKDLTEADKVRNYMLMSLTKEQQNDYYKKYWKKIEEYTDDDPTMFIRDYLTIHLKRICNINNLYFEFKLYDEQTELNREDFFRDLLTYAGYYYQVVKGKTSNKKINRKLHQLANIGSSVALPFYMSLFIYADTDGIGEDEIYQVLDITENYWAVIICGYPANVLQKLFATLHYDVLKIIETHERREILLESSYSDLVKYILLKKQGNAVFPTDSELIESFKNRKIYKLPINYRYFLFERMENEDSNERITDLVERMEEGSITIEHVMPQTLNAQWKHELGINFEEVHEKYLHTFANLTLTGYNTNYSNHSFQEKKNGFINRKGEWIHGFSESGFRLSDFLKRCSNWTEAEIVERERILRNKFLRLWPRIESKYEPLEKEVENVSFSDDEFDLVGRSIVAFVFQGEKYVVSSWKEMLLNICQIVYEMHRTSVLSLARKNYWLFDHSAPHYSKIADNCWVNASNSTKTKQAIIRNLFQGCNISENDLEFHLEPQRE